MSGTAFLDGRVTLHAGDCLQVLAGMPENSVDSVVTDPPYHLTSIVKRFGAGGAAQAKAGATGAYQRASSGFMGKVWDGGDVAFQPATWAAALRVLKPGGYLLAFASTRGFGRMSVAIEDGGFITHPLIAWVFGSGFPKAHNAARAIDRELGVEGGKAAVGDPVRRIRPGADQHKDGSWEKLEDRVYQPGSYVPGSPEAEEWLGWSYGGQALKPAIEPIYMGQKPFSMKNGAANILKHGTGALNIGACRVETADWDAASMERANSPGSARNVAVAATEGKFGRPTISGPMDTSLGRWPANLIHDGSDEVFAAFPEAPGQAAAVTGSEPTANGFSGTVYGYGGKAQRATAEPRNDSGSAARFFYQAKADSADRLGSKHPTVKPLDLMQYLCRLVTPPGGTVLDPFAGTGTTGEAAWREGFKAILIEREAEYLADIARRMELAVLPTKRAAVAKTKNNLMGAEGTPLFSQEAAE